MVSDKDFEKKDESESKTELTEMLVLSLLLKPLSFHAKALLTPEIPLLEEKLALAEKLALIEPPKKVEKINELCHVILKKIVQKNQQLKKVDDDNNLGQEFFFYLTKLTYAYLTTSLQKSLRFEIATQHQVACYEPLVLATKRNTALIAGLGSFHQEGSIVHANSTRISNVSKFYQFREFYRIFVIDFVTNYARRKVRAAANNWVKSSYEPANAEFSLKELKEKFTFLDSDATEDWLLSSSFSTSLSTIKEASRNYSNFMCYNDERHQTMSDLLKIFLKMIGARLNAYKNLVKPVNNFELLLLGDLVLQALINEDQTGVPIPVKQKPVQNIAPLLHRIATTKPKTNKVKGFLGTMLTTDQKATITDRFLYWKSLCWPDDDKSITQQCVPLAQAKRLYPSLAKITDKLQVRVELACIIDEGKNFVKRYSSTTLIEKTNARLTAQRASKTFNEVFHEYEYLARFRNHLARCELSNPFLEKELVELLLLDVSPQLEAIFKTVSTSMSSFLVLFAETPPLQWLAQIIRSKSLPANGLEEHAFYFGLLQDLSNTKTLYHQLFLDCVEHLIDSHYLVDCEQSETENLYFCIKTFEKIRFDAQVASSKGEGKYGHNYNHCVFAFLLIETLLACVKSRSELSELTLLDANSSLSSESTMKPVYSDQLGLAAIDDFLTLAEKKVKARLSSEFL